LIFHSHLNFSLVSKKTCPVLMQFDIMKEVLNYFYKHHSTINITALDISKAFDKLNHFVLINKLLDRSVSVRLVKVLVCWYAVM